MVKTSNMESKRGCDGIANIFVYNINLYIQRGAHIMSFSAIFILEPFPPRNHHI